MSHRQQSKEPFSTTLRLSYYVSVSDKLSFFESDQGVATCIESNSLSFSKCCRYDHYNKGEKRSSHCKVLSVKEETPSEL